MRDEARGGERGEDRRGERGEERGQGEEGRGRRTGRKRTGEEGRGEKERRQGRGDQEGRDEEIKRSLIFTTNVYFLIQNHTISECEIYAFRWLTQIELFLHIVLRKILSFNLQLMLRELLAKDLAFLDEGLLQRE